MSTAPEFNPEDNISTELEKEYIRPPDKFDGGDLWPYTRGSRLLMAQVFSDEDTVIYRALAFVFVHKKRGAPTAQEDMERNIIPLAWDLSAFRAAIVAMRSDIGNRGDTVADALEKEALTVYRSAIDREVRSRITVAPTGIGAGLQKKRVTTRTPRPGTRVSSRKSGKTRKK